MDFFSVLALLGGLAIFLYGMNLMGDGLAKVAGGKLERILETLTSNPIRAVLLGMGVTAVIQSSSATTVMVVGFVNSGIMKLSQVVGIIMGANIGTTVTSWILSLTGIQSDNFIIQLFKPTSFSPILALIGVVLIMFTKSQKKKDVGAILVGFAILMYGMNAMSGAVEPLAEVPEFTGMLVKFSNPILGVVAGAVLTAIIQSSSASVGTVQCSTSYYHGTEYRYLYHCDPFSHRSQQKRKTCGYGTSVFQSDRNHAVHGSILCDKCSSTFFIYDAGSDSGRDRDSAQCLQYYGNSCPSSVRKGSGEACLPYYPRQEGRAGEGGSRSGFHDPGKPFSGETCICS